MKFEYEKEEENRDYLLAEGEGNFTVKTAEETTSYSSGLPMDSQKWRSFHPMFAVPSK